MSTPAYVFMENYEEYFSDTLLLSQICLSLLALQSVGWSFISKAVVSLSPDSIFSIIFSFLFEGLQSSTAYNDLISYIP